MTTANQLPTPAALAARIRPLAGRIRRLRSGLRRPHFGPLEWAFLVIALAAAAMRLWQLDGRTMHYDEAIHLHYAWQLAQGTEFAHSPWMHGPLQIELVAIFIRLFGDTDFIARIPYALFGVILVILPYFLRRQIGAWGAGSAAVILALSPALLYFSRFGRNDILMAVWALTLLILLWRYSERPRARYLYGAAAVTALMLATKETAYFVILFMGLAAFGLGWRAWLPLLRRPQTLPAVTGAAGFFIFLATLTLPQAAAALSVIQEPLGLTLASHDAGSTSETGAPVWTAPFAALPLWNAPFWIHLIAAATLLTGGIALAWRCWRMRMIGLLALAVAIAASATAVAIAFTRPFLGALTGTMDGTIDDAGGTFWAAAADPAAVVILIWVALLALWIEGISWRRIALAAGLPALLTLLWLLLFTPAVGILDGAIPRADAADLAQGRIALNYLLPAAAMLIALVAGAIAGIAWGGGRWLGCAALFYALWTALYTTLYTNAAGIFTGAWQSLGYWLAQQDVARGNQPWYYYLVGLTVYELLALTFGIAAIIWLIRRRQPFGILLAAWALATLAIYTIAAEKMPWLLVNITLPLSLAAAALLGSMLERIEWRRLRWRPIALFVLTPAWLIAAIAIAWLPARADAGGDTLALWLAALILLPAAAGLAWLMRGQPHAARAAALGIAALLLASGTAAAVRAAYTYDDSNLEILVYAQGAHDLAQTYAELRQNALPSDALSDDTLGGAAPPQGVVKVDYDMWYPFQWYVRRENEQGILQYDNFCPAALSGSTDSCRRVGEDTAPVAYLAEAAHAPELPDTDPYRRDGPRRNLLWYPETYRRPGETRTETGMWQQLAADVSFFRDAAADPQKWQQAIAYYATRHQQTDWFKADFYHYTRQ